jgi:T5SS/PEP-CTERM-associated repeat protein
VFRRSTLVIFAASLLASPLATARAAITASGDISPANPSAWTPNTYGYIGPSAGGTLTVDGGSNLVSANGYLGYFNTGKGVVNVAGAGSKWDNAALYVGFYGSGTLSITGGGTVTSAYSGYIDGAASAVTVDGTGSALSVNSYFEVGDTGHGTLRISHGGRMTCSGVMIGWNGNSSGAVTVDGAGSIWTDRGSLEIGSPGYGNTGTLAISNGGRVTANNVTLDNNRSLLTLDVGRGSCLEVAGGTGSLGNYGTIRVVAGAGSPAGEYYPISAGTWGGTGTCQGLGGTWDPVKRKILVYGATSGTSGSPVPLDLSYQQRALVNGNLPGQANWQVGASFPAASSTTNITFTATAMSSTTLDTLQALLPARHSILSGWNLATTNYSVSSTNPLYLSFNVGAGHSTDDLNLWQYDGGTWTKYAPLDLTYDGSYASFTATGLTGYAMVAVPEPGTLVLLVAGLFALATCVRRERAAG